MNIVIVGLNHDTAPIDVREKVAFDGSKLADAIVQLKGLPEVKESIILSTCNRVEIYANVNNPESGTENLKKFISDFHKIPGDVLEKSLYSFTGKKALTHIFRVASSLDSMIVGEPQILGQMKDAFDFALKQKSTSVLLNKMMKKSISVAKKVRTDTKIGESAVSISFAAVELAKKIFEDLSAKTFILIGAGEMAELAARHLIESGVRDVLVTNRTYERAEELAHEFHGKAVEYESFLQELVHTDIVICSTGAPHYILHKDQMHQIMKQRKNKPVFIIDISVPRNIDPQINDIDNIYLYDIDDLQGVVNVNIEERSREAEKAEEIVDNEVETFLKWQASLSAVPTIVALRQKAEAIRDEETRKTLRKLERLGASEIKSIESMTSSIVKKLIHFPTSVLKSDSEDKETIIEIVSRMFNLNTTPNSQSTDDKESGDTENANKE
ncbi:MAG: glutamyl-tRNA reductase [Nitrospiraceae bacterium]|nr:MAG: glutamyl-tRNA reductase [Nitrospiraceae bacterium]